MALSPQTYVLARDVETNLRALNYPVRIAYGPDAVAREGREIAIVIQRDREQGDAVEYAPGVQANPRKVKARMLGCVARVYVRSSKPNATLWDHEALCDHIVDALVVALYEWGVAGKVGPTGIPITQSRYMRPEELKRTEEQWAGVVYLLKFQVPRGVVRQNYAGEGRPESELAGVTSRTDASGPAGSDDVGCGG